VEIHPGVRLKLLQGMHRVALAKILVDPGV